MITTAISIPKTDPQTLPTEFYDGVITAIGTTAKPISVTSTKISKGVFLTLRTLGSNTYIAIGNSASQNLRYFKTVGDTIFYDLANDLSLIYLLGDNAASDGIVEYNAG